MNFKRIFLIVLDSVGIGETSDSYKFGDIGVNTLKNTIEKTGVSLPNLESLGMLSLIYDNKKALHGYGMRANPISIGKDTLTGHLEMMGVQTIIPFKTFTEQGFPVELITELEQKTNRKVIGNKNASGTEIIEELGKEHMETGNIIVYTSADSVLQIAAHEDVVSLEELYKICEIARELTLNDEWKVGRVIARPFTGLPGNFIRTGNRRDYALNPASKTVLDNLKANNLEVISVGKISDVFNGQGITKNFKTKDNQEGINIIKQIIDMNFTGLCFANLNDFDSLYGHRRNVEGYAEALLQFDNSIPSILNKLNEDDLLILTADHGNDPTYQGTDHTREMIPVIVYNNKFKNFNKLEDLSSFADIGATIAENFKVPKTNIGTSFLRKLK